MEKNSRSTSPSLSVPRNCFSIVYPFPPLHPHLPFSSFHLFLPVTLPPSLPLPCSPPFLALSPPPAPHSPPSPRSFPSLLFNSLPVPPFLLSPSASPSRSLALSLRVPLPAPLPTLLLALASSTERESTFSQSYHKIKREHCTRKYFLLCSTQPLAYLDSHLPRPSVTCILTYLAPRYLPRIPGRCT